MTDTKTIEITEETFERNVLQSEQPGLAQAHEVRSIPTTILFRDGVEVERLVGVVDGWTLRSTLPASAAR